MIEDLRDIIKKYQSELDKHLSQQPQALKVIELLTFCSTFLSAHSYAYTQL